MVNKQKQLRRERNRLDKEWRLKALERDGHKCVICGSTERINVHHIISRSVKELRHDLDNAICVCALHHMFDRYISCHKGSFAFIIWFINNRNQQFIRLSDKLNKLR